MKQPKSQDENNNPVTLLRKLGLSRSGAICYLYLMDWWPQAVRTTHAVKEIKLPQSTIFRALNELTEKGFIHRSQITGTASWRAEPLTHALDNYSERLRQLARPLIREQRTREAKEL